MKLRAVSARFILESADIEGWRWRRSSGRAGCVTPTMTARVHPAGELVFGSPTAGGKERLQATDDGLTPFGGWVPWAAFSRHTGILESLADPCPVPRTSPNAAPRLDRRTSGPRRPAGDPAGPGAPPLAAAIERPIHPGLRVAQLNCAAVENPAAGAPQPRRNPHENNFELRKLESTRSAIRRRLKFRATTEAHPAVGIPAIRGCSSAVGRQSSLSSPISWPRLLRHS